MSKKKTEDELEQDLKDELTTANSREERIELLLIAILRELKGIKAK